MGLHGAGVAVANYLSRTFEVTSWGNGRATHIGFEQGACTGIDALGVAEGSGTRVVFEPDDTIFEEPRWDVTMIRARCRELAGIEPGLRISVNGEAFHFATVADYLREGREVIEPLEVDVIEADVRVRLALGWHEGKKSIRTLVNGSPAGGAHVVAFQRAVQAVFARRLGRSVRATQLARGMVAVLHVMLDHPRFANPTKEWLANPEVAEAVRVVVERELDRHLDLAPGLLDALLLRWEASAARGRARPSSARPRTTRRTPAAPGSRSS